MNELTRERYPHDVPWAERYARPGHVPRYRPPAWLVNLRRRRLCGTHDLTVMYQGGDRAELARVGERRLVEAIRSLAVRR